MFDYEIVEHIAVLSTSTRGNTLEVNRISFSGKPPKWDIRRWMKEEDGTRRMLKGCTLSDAEVLELKKALEGAGK